MVKKIPKEDRSKSNLSFFFVMILILIVILTAIIIASLTPNKKIDGRTIQEAVGNFQNERTSYCRDVQVPYEHVIEEWETVQYTDRECEAKNLPYSIENFIQNYNRCSEEEYICRDERWWGCADKEYYCVEKTASCSLDLRNLDNEIAGSWEISMNYIDRDSGKIIISEKLNNYLYPQTERKVTSRVMISSLGVDGDANKEVRCSHQITKIPTKQVCRDVIKWKQIPVTRTETRYRTETKCD